MNSLRSTEKGLALVAIRSSSKLTKKNSKTFDLPLALNRRYSFKSKSNCRDFFRPKYANDIRPKIKLPEYKLIYQPVRSLETKVQLDFPLINPNKLAPERPQEGEMASIVPLTHSKFPKNAANTAQSVTKILSATMPAAAAYALEKWKENMIKQLGLASFNKYQQDTLKRGHALHAIVANYLLGQGEPTAADKNMSNEVVSNLWKSIKTTVCEKITNPRLVEHIVTHKDMNYRGIIDCVAFYNGELSVIDFKTAEKKKKGIDTLYDNPIQVSAYCGALNNDTSIPSHVIDRNVTSGVLIVAYVDGSEADTYFLDQEKITGKYWKQWLTRLDQFVRLPEGEQKKKKTI